MGVDSRRIHGGSFDKGGCEKEFLDTWICPDLEITSNLPMFQILLLFSLKFLERYNKTLPFNSKSSNHSHIEYWYEILSGNFNKRRFTVKFQLVLNLLSTRNDAWAFLFVDTAIKFCWVLYR